MTLLNLEGLKEQILKLCSRHPKQYFRTKEFALRFSVKTDEEYQTLVHALHDLQKAKLIGIVRRKRYYYIPRQALNALEGILTLTKQGQGEVELLPPEKGKILIPARFTDNALNGDTVKIVKLARPTASEMDKKAEREEGEIIEIVQRSNRPIVGTFEKSKHFFFVVPDDNRVGRDIYIEKGKTMGARPRQKVAVVIDEWKSRHLNPEGHIVEILGKAGEVSVEMASVVKQFNLPSNFPKSVLIEAEKISEVIPEKEYKSRQDLRTLECFTIDPEDAKDFDDAVSLEELSGGNYRLGVHIADVSHYVREGSDLDKEALKRGTSIYLPNSVIPMLPEKLSNVVCSLRPLEDRLTYSIFITLTPKLVLKEYQIVKSIIKSKQRFTYEEVQKIVEAKKGNFAETILSMHDLSKKLLAKRIKEGSIDFESVETKFKFDKYGNPTDIQKKIRLDSHRIIEEFMLLANYLAAKHVGYSRKEENIKPFIYRVHDRPDPDKLNDFISFVNYLGYSLKPGGGLTPKALQKLLNDVKGTEEENVINEVAIRTMAKALYSTENIGHFGLGFRYYSHFTSPIRRYPDLMVHRLIEEYDQRLSYKHKEELSKRLPEICELSSKREQLAMEAERESVKVMQIEYMKRHLGNEFHAIISGVVNFGLFIEISDLLVQGLVRVRDMEDDYYIFDEKNYSLIGKHKKKRYRLGDRVNVQVIRVDPEEREIDFVLV